MICQGCGTENGAERRFCEGCAGRLEAGCPACGTLDAAQGEGVGITARVGVLFESAGRQALQGEGTSVAGWRPLRRLP